MLVLILRSMMNSHPMGAALKFASRPVQGGEQKKRLKLYVKRNDKKVKNYYNMLSVWGRHVS